ncbi:hypothetical protein Glove_543g16 [Diversispora epigaea]|uniref:Uncharacterized protein n=1 Tax=Diversispora epigaea TaxID=1348612 RepID=A0A397GFS4_9GLOM|nr:hypothetical protein Glove_543g16 [Diversispora epigaea]
MEEQLAFDSKQIDFKFLKVKLVLFLYFNDAIIEKKQYYLESIGVTKSHAVYSAHGIGRFLVRLKVTQVFETVSNKFISLKIYPERFFKSGCTPLRKLSKLKTAVDRYAVIGRPLPGINVHIKL